MPTEVDALILGAGTAGCATAIALRQLGQSCLVVERAKGTRVCVAEMLAPYARHPLAALGLWNQFLDAGHLPCVAVRSAWGAATPEVRESIADPYGSGWHLDRCRFDAQMASQARAWGVEVLQEAQLRCCEGIAGGGWEANIGCAAGRTVRARFAVDATGRAASFARARGARRVVMDRLIGVVGCYRSIRPKPVAAGSLLLESAPLGWWYCAPLPDAGLVVAFMTDADLLAKNWDFKSALAKTAHVVGCVRGFVLQSLHKVAAYSSVLSPMCGHYWMAVGDAAATIDPLSGQGILRSLESGIRTASAIQSCLAGRSAVVAQTEAKALNEFDRYLQIRQAHCAQEKRWPDSPFWRRRQGQAADTGASGATTLPVHRASQ